MVNKRRNTLLQMVKERSREPYQESGEGEVIGDEQPAAPAKEAPSQKEEKVKGQKEKATPKRKPGRPKKSASVAKRGGRFKKERTTTASGCIRVGYLLPPELHQRIKLVASLRNEEISTVAEEALEYYLRKIPEKQIVDAAFGLMERYETEEPTDSEP